MAIATPSPNIVSVNNPGTNPNNTVAIYWFNTTDNGLTMQTQVWAGNLNQPPNSVLNIMDIAASGENIVVLEMNTFIAFTYNFVSLSVQNSWSFNITVPSTLIGVYQNGFTSTIALVQYLTITEVTIFPGSTKPVVNVYDSPQSFDSAIGVTVTATFIAVQTTSSVFVYERSSYHWQNLFGLFPAPQSLSGGVSPYAFKLLLNDYAVTIGPFGSSIYFVSQALITASVNQNDRWVLTATSNTPGASVTCSSIIGVTQLPSDYQTWGVYATNNSYSSFANGLTLPNGAQQ